MHPQPSHDFAPWDARFSEGFGGTSKTMTQTESVTARANRCFHAKSSLQEVLAWDRDASDDATIWQLPESPAFFFISRMTIDADGAPNAYNRDDTGLDELRNAGVPGRWDGIITDKAGIPLVQQESDPFPGYYISCTSLSDGTKRFADPTSYVNASKIPYVALPRHIADRGGARLGDFALVVNLHNHQSSFAIYADIGTLGEGSIALADALGISSDARQGGQSDGILYLLFPGSGNLRPRTNDEIQHEGEKLFSDWGGVERLSSCLETQDVTVTREGFGVPSASLH